MKKIKLKEIWGYFPFTIRKAHQRDKQKMTPEKAILRAKMYQSEDVNSQQPYKPISKIIQFDE